jgi:hypothetical protein
MRNTELHWQQVVLMIEGRDGDEGKVFSPVDRFQQSSPRP